VVGASNRGRTGTPLFRKAADFKSAVSTNFTIEAHNILFNKNAPPARAVGRNCAKLLEARPGVEPG
jgi:hypothetical protein